MEVVNLLKAILDHVLITVIYVARRLMRYPRITDVDRSSILERKEEIKQLWEKKMMSSNEAADHKDEVKVTAEPKIVAHHSEMNGSATKIANGSSPHEIDDAIVKEQAENVIVKSVPLDSNKTDETKLSKMNGKVDVEGMEFIDAPELKESETNSGVTSINDKEDKAIEDDHRGEATALEAEVEGETLPTPMERQTDEVLDVEEKGKEIVECVIEEAQKIATLRSEGEDENVKEVETETPQQSVDTTELTINDIPQEKDVESQENLKEECEIQDQDSLEFNYEAKKEDEKITLPMVDADDDFHEIGKDVVFASSAIEKEDIMDETNSNHSYHEDSLNESLPEQTDSLADEPTAETLIAEQDDKEEKTFDDNFILDTQELVSPVEDEDKTVKKPRSALSVQKTEQPYSTCTTETKIAMEIREMREREEELKLMRERQVVTSPVQKQPKQASAPVKTVISTAPKQHVINGYATFSATKASSTPGYRASSVFGPRGGSYMQQQQPKEDTKTTRNFNKETAVEREIRLAKDREEELRKQKGLPPREDDSYVKPSQVKSSQVKVFSKMGNADNSRILATAKIQHEIEEQTQREVALRDMGHIQTLSTERTDAKVTKLSAFDINASPECTSPTFQNGTSHLYPNGNHANGHVSPTSHSKRSTPSPTGSSHASRNIAPIQNKVNMQKFIASRGKETTFSAPRIQPPKAVELPEISRSTPEPGKLKRTVSVESKIQQEILEMKQREEELKQIHFGKDLGSENSNGHEVHHLEYENGESIGMDPCPRRSNLIAQWEQRIQNAA